MLKKEIFKSCCQFVFRPYAADFHTPDFTMWTAYVIMSFWNIHKVWKKNYILYVQTFSEDALYAWQYDRPSSPWRFLFAVLLVIVVLLLCLFPLAPQPVKLGVVYLSMTLLIVIFTVIAIRSVIAAVTWISTGRTLWLFPNMLSDVSLNPLTSWSSLQSILLFH